MKHIAFNLIEDTNTHQEANRLIQSLVASLGAEPIETPVRTRIAYKPIWEGKPWELRSLKWDDAQAARLEYNGTRVFGASFSMREVKKDYARRESIVARTEGLLFWNWLFHRSKSVVETWYWTARVSVAGAYENLYCKKLFTRYAIDIPKSETGLYWISMMDIDTSKPISKSLTIGNALSNHKRFFPIGSDHMRARFLVLRADGFHYVPALWNFLKHKLNSHLIDSLLLDDHPEVAIVKRNPSFWQRLCPRPVDRYSTMRW